MTHSTHFQLKISLLSPTESLSFSTPCWRGAKLPDLDTLVQEYAYDFIETPGEFAKKVYTLLSKENPNLKTFCKKLKNKHLIFPISYSKKGELLENELEEKKIILYQAFFHITAALLLKNLYTYTECIEPQTEGYFFFQAKHMIRVISRDFASDQICKDLIQSITKAGIQFIEKINCLKFHQEMMEGCQVLYDNQERINNEWAIRDTWTKVYKCKKLASLLRKDFLFPQSSFQEDCEKEIKKLTNGIQRNNLIRRASF